jgi:uncharacterized protein YndB with AHSA1/START domain
MKVVLIIASVVVAAVVLILVVGALLPVRHVATRTAVVAAPIDAVFATLVDVEAAPRWRPDVASVTMLPSEHGLVRWRERSGHQEIPFERIEEQAPKRIVNRIATDDLPFGGTWTYELATEASGTRVTITETGDVKNVFFRFMSRFVFGHTAGMEAYLAALGKKHGLVSTATSP